MLCFVKENNVSATSENWQLCGPIPNGGAVHCCVNGQECLSDGFCHASNLRPGNSGYYLGGCSDGNFPGSYCPSPCGEYQGTDAVYNFYGDGTWTCCTDVSLCNNPTGQNFTAPPKKQLVGIATIISTQDGSKYPSTVVASALSSADAALSASGLTQFVSFKGSARIMSSSAPITVSTSSLSVSSASRTQSTIVNPAVVSNMPIASKDISSGAVAGILTGAFAFLLVIGGMAFPIRRYRSSKQRLKALENVMPPAELSSSSRGLSYLQLSPQELSGQGDRNGNRGELYGDYVQVVEMSAASQVAAELPQAADSFSKWH